MTMLAAAVALLALALPSRAETCAAGAAILAPAEPEQLGLSSAVLARLVADLRQEDRDIRGLVVARHCRIAVELYARDVGRDHNHSVYSVTKSALATLAGALVQHGKLASIDTPVASLMPRRSLSSPRLHPGSNP